MGNQISISCRKALRNNSKIVSLTCEMDKGRVMDVTFFFFPFLFFVGGGGVGDGRSVEEHTPP